MGVERASVLRPDHVARPRRLLRSTAGRAWQRGRYLRGLVDRLLTQSLVPSVAKCSHVCHVRRGALFAALP